MFMGMDHLKTCLNPSLISKGLHRESPCISEFSAIHTKHITESALVKCRKRIKADCMNPREKSEVVGYVKWVSASLVRNGGKSGIMDRRASWPCKTNSTPAGEVGVVRKEAQDVICGVGEEQFGYLVREYGWGVRRLVEEEEKMRKVAQVQAEAFHEPKALFNDLFFLFFQAEVLSALFYKIRNSPPNRYACLVAEPIDRPDSLNTSKEGLVGVVDVTVMRDEDVLKHIDGAEEYLYVSGIAVMKDFRKSPSIDCDWHKFPYFRVVFYIGAKCSYLKMKCEIIYVTEIAFSQMGISPVPSDQSSTLHFVEVGFVTTAHALKGDGTCSADSYTWESVGCTISHEKWVETVVDTGIFR